jgi:hypothetical protein
VKNFQALTLFPHSSEHLIYAKVEFQEIFLLTSTLEQRFFGFLSFGGVTNFRRLPATLAKGKLKFYLFIARNTGLFVMKLPDNRLLSSSLNSFSILKFFYLTWLYP